MEFINDLKNRSNPAERRTLFTSKEVKELGISYSEEPPNPEKCKYCGKTLYYQAIVILGKVICWNKSFPQRCDCKNAAEYWKRYDARQEQKKRETEETERRRKLQQKIDRLITDSGIGKRFRQRTFENFKIDSQCQNAYIKAKRYADEFSRYAENGTGIYFEGKNGTGKTHLAVAIALQLMNQGVPVICKTSIDLLADIKKAYDNEKISEASVLSVYKAVDLLIIDDLGKEQCTEWSMSVLYAIINERYESMKPTIITTNYNEDMLISRMTLKNGDSSNIEAIISRLRESTEVVTMAWEDYRSKGVIKNDDSPN